MPRTIVVAGALAQKPEHGGLTWFYLHFLLGFRRLGWEVCFLDRLEPEMCVDRAGQPCLVERSVNLEYFLRTLRAFGLADSFSLLYDGGRRHIGLSRAQTLEAVRRSALLLNVMGYLNDEEVLARASRRVFLDIDPGFPQMWKELGLHDAFRGHDVFVTLGRNIGRPDCAIPTCGLSWVTLPQP